MEHVEGPGDVVRRAESALRAMGYAKVAPATRPGSGPARFWVQEGGVPRRRLPVYLLPEGGGKSKETAAPWFAPGRAGPSATPGIVVVPTQRDAETAWQLTRGPPTGSFDTELSILVVPSAAEPEGPAHWHTGIVPPGELLRLATGVVVGLFKRAQRTEGSTQIDFEELLEVLRSRFRVDVHRSLHVTNDEEALFILYQLAQRDSYAPGDSSSNLHLITLRPTGPAARLPWFAA
ncbi:MAG: hypothetical protein L3J87_02745 [Thermoplasmata archaeon]|nr:hypothetical protein [Thermoplasmata archaeon]MCI4344526.1 hypothetical protein [Thermoplasmata archaeon]